MKASRLFFPTLKETPKEATINSHILMLRAGMVRKLASGLYAYLPMGHRMHKKVVQIVEEEMDRVGGQEFLPPILTSRELWEESGRYELMGPLMFRLKDRHSQDYVLGPTHEEAFTDLVRQGLNSYRQLPLIVYQIYKKFRDEIRPRFGVMRGREFTMKDAYSFHIDADDLDKTYQAMRQAYRRIFTRCGLDTVPVQADSGSMGGKASEEFMVRSHIGEDTIIECPKCGYIANSERAECKIHYTQSSENQLNLEKVHTPNIKTIEDLTKFFSATGENFIKSLIYQSEDGEKIMVLIRGDLDVNEIKLNNAMGGKEFTLADDKAVYEVTKAPVGFAGPIGITGIKIIADESVKYMVNAITGANQKDYHYKNVNINRDFKVDLFAQLMLTKAGHSCIVCGEKLNAFEGIEVGHIFKLGYRYTESMKVTYLDQQGKEKTPIMGTYGIGIDRTIATIVEQNNDKDGIILPISIAPFEVIICALGKDEELKVGEKIYEELCNSGIETLLDDRDLSPGVKFKDADLTGIPIRVTIGKKGLKENKAEVKLRRDSTKNESVDLSQIGTYIKNLVTAEKKLIQEKIEHLKF